MKKNHNIVALENKFESFSNWVDLKNEHPKRYLNMPVDEENMVGIAAGLNFLKKISVSKKAYEILILIEIHKEP